MCACKEKMENRIYYARFGVTESDADALRLIAKKLHKFYEREAGDANGVLERDETTKKVYWFSARLGRRTHTMRDTETAALKSLAKIAKNYENLKFEKQTDCRGYPITVTFCQN